MALEATPALPQPPISLAAPLGSTASYMLSAANPTAAEAAFSSSSSSPDRFWLNPGSFKVGAQGVKDRGWKGWVQALQCLLMHSWLRMARMHFGQH